MTLAEVMKPLGISLGLWLSGPSHIGVLHPSAFQSDLSPTLVPTQHPINKQEASGGSTAAPLPTGSHQAILCPLPSPTLPSWRLASLLYFFFFGWLFLFLETIPIWFHPRGLF